MWHFPLAHTSVTTKSKGTTWHLAAVIFLCSVGFTQSTAPVPQIGNPLVPMAVLPGSVGFSLTVNGTGFVSGSTVYWNGSPRSTTFVSNSQLIAAIPASDVATATSGSVTVHNPGGTISNVALLLVTTPVITPSFGAAEIPQTVTQGSFYWGILSGDYDGDGFADVAINQSQYLEIAQGNGDGTFQYPVNYPIPGSTEAYGDVLGDFNNDGTLDFGVSSRTTNSMDIFLSNRDGTLQPATQSLLSSGFAVSAAGDFDGDGNLDLAYTAANGVGILLGKGNGSFHPPSFFLLANSPEAVAVGDFNRDGILDIAATNFVSGGGSAVVSILLGRGDGTFAPHVDYPVGYAPEPIAIGDLNGDGYPDIVISDAALYNSFYVLLNKGDGTFAPAITYGGLDTLSELRAIALGDFNGDGKLDAAVYEEFPCTAGCVLIFAGKGDGTLLPPNEYDIRQDRGNSQYGLLALEDFNRDGKLDIVTPAGNGPYVMIQTAASAPTLSPGSLSFAAQVVGTQSQSQTIGLYQPGNTAITITNAAATGDFQVPSNFDCVLNPGNTYCFLGVTFAPAAAGTRTGTLTISSSGGMQYVSLIGSGVTGTVNVTVSPSSLSFQTQPLKALSPYQSVFITNTGTSTLSLTSITLTGANPGEFKLVNENCGSTISPGASCFVEIASQPTQRGVRTATLGIADNASNSPQTVSLSGTGATNSLSASSLNFGGVAVGTSSMQMLMLTNVGISPTMIGKVSIAGANSADYSENNNCGASLAAKASCSFNVIFTPSVKGVRKASLTFASNGTGMIAPTNVPLTGTGK